MSWAALGCLTGHSPWGKLDYVDMDTDTGLGAAPQVTSHCAGSHSWACLLPLGLLIPWPMASCHFPQLILLPCPPAQPGSPMAVAVRNCLCHIPAVPSLALERPGWRLGTAQGAHGPWAFLPAASEGSQTSGKCFAITFFRASQQLTALVLRN